MTADSAAPERIWRGIDTSAGSAGFCEACGVDMPTGPDACLGFLPLTSHACCGHGGVAKPYLVLSTAGSDADMALVRHSLTLWGRPALLAQHFLRRFRHDR